MLKGKAEIILTDTVTGEVTRMEEENLVTNAVQDLISMNPAGHNTVGIPWGLPLCPYAIGGVLLFPETIEEDASKYYAPTSLVPTGYSSNSVDSTADPKRGSFNTNESYRTDNGYRLVFDFGTSDANGTTSCVCLTSTDGGRAYFGSNYVGSSGNNMGQYSWAKGLTGRDTSVPQGKGNQYGCIGAADGTKVYGARTLNEKSIEWNEWRQRLTTMPLGQGYYLDTNTLQTTTIATDKWYASSGYTKDGEYSSGYQSGWTYFNYRSTTCFDGCSFYRWYAEQGSDTIRLCRVNGGVKSEWEMTYSGVAFGNGDAMTVCNGYLYAWANDRTGVYRCHITDPTDWKLIPLPDGTGIANSAWYGLYSPFSDGRLYCSWNYTANGATTGYSAVIHDDVMERVYRNYEQSYWVDGSYTWRRGFRMGPYMLTPRNHSSYYGWHLDVITPYLATINNLASPITKTVTQTMKIIYTLTEE